jgi:hypothetical protein
MELRNLNEENFATIENLRKSYEDRLEEIVQTGMTQGVFQVSDSKIATMAVIGLLKETSTWYRPDGRLSAAQLVEIYQKMVLQVLGAHI